MIDKDDILSPQTIQTIKQHINTLCIDRDALLGRIAELEAEGCIHGNIAEEFRNVLNKKKVQGPYYRLHYYKDPVTGKKPKPKYIGADLDKVRQTPQQIDNWYTCQEYREKVNEIERVLNRARNDVDRLVNFLKFSTRDYQQLVIKPVAGPGPNHTNHRRD